MLELTRKAVLAIERESELSEVMLIGKPTYKVLLKYKDLPINITS